MTLEHLKLEPSDPKFPIIHTKGHSTFSDEICDPEHPKYDHKLAVLTGESFILYGCMAVLHRSLKVWKLELEDIKKKALLISGGNRQWKQTILQPLVEAELVYENGDGTYSNIAFCLVNDSYLLEGKKATRSIAGRAKKVRPEFMPDAKKLAEAKKKKTDTDTPANPAPAQVFQAEPKTEQVKTEQTKTNTFKPKTPETKTVTPTATTVTNEPPTVNSKDNSFQNPEARDELVLFRYYRNETETEKEKKVRLAGLKRFHDLSPEEKLADELAYVAQHPDGSYCHRQNFETRSYQCDKTGNKFYKGPANYCNQCVEYLDLQAYVTAQLQLEKVK